MTTGFHEDFLSLSFEMRVDQKNAVVKTLLAEKPAVYFTL